MAKVCLMCAKSTAAGRSIQHRHAGKWVNRAPRSVRTFKPNLRSVNLEFEGKLVKATVCMKCYKRLRKDVE